MQQPNTIDIFWTRVSFSLLGCWIWTGSVSSYGYGRFPVGGKYVKAYKLAFEHFYGVVLPARTNLLHSCNNPLCVNPMHLKIGTLKDNADDRGLAGNTVSKLTHTQVSEIREALASGVSQTTIASQYGVHKSGISRINTGDRFKELR